MERRWKRKHETAGGDRRIMYACEIWSLKNNGTHSVLVTLNNSY